MTTPVIEAYLNGQIDHYKALFEECQNARDAVGFLGSVPECIQYLAEQVTTLEQQLAAKKSPAPFEDLLG
jgi:hypothetical protein